MPQFEDDSNDGHIKFSSETMRLPWNSPSAPSCPNAPTSSTSQVKATHKRSFSGGILAKLNFLGRPPSRGEQDAPQRPKSPKSTKSRKSIDDDNETAVSPVSPTKGESAMAAALKQNKTRKRKGSLRKTALLGGRRLVTEGRERKNTILQRSPSSKQPKQSLEQEMPAPTPAKLLAGDLDPPAFPLGNDSNTSLRERFSYENVEANESSDSGWGESAAATSARLSLLTEHRAQPNGRKASTELASPLDLKSPVSQASYTSTTDDDDVLTFDRPANNFVGQPRETISLSKPLSSTATSYFPSMTSVSVESVARRSNSKQRSSPLSNNNTTTLSSYPEPEPHDYTETEYWGWMILFATWLTFTVGMGSCLEIWSWAWDVGETPYAPPELEDDPTLPIVGYYPALIVLTGVVVWVWILVAWLGIKYFKHAKIEV